MALEIIRQSLVNLFLPDSGAFPDKQCTQNQIWDFLSLFLSLVMLLGFSLKHAFELERVTLK